MHVDQLEPKWQKLAFVTMNDLGLPNGINEERYQSTIFNIANGRLYDIVSTEYGIHALIGTAGSRKDALEGKNFGNFKDRVVRTGSMHYRNSRDALRDLVKKFPKDGPNAVHGNQLARFTQTFEELGFKFPMTEDAVNVHAETIQKRWSIGESDFDNALMFAKIQHAKMDVAKNMTYAMEEVLEALEMYRQLKVIDASFYDAVSRFKYADLLIDSAQVSQDENLAGFAQGMKENEFGTIMGIMEQIKEGGTNPISTIEGRLAAFFEGDKYSFFGAGKSVGNMIENEVKNRLKPSERWRETKPDFDGIVAELLAGKPEMSAWDKREEQRRLDALGMLNNRQSPIDKEALVGRIGHQLLQMENEDVQEGLDLDELAERYFEFGHEEDRLALIAESNRMISQTGTDHGLGEIIKRAERMWAKKSVKAVKNDDRNKVAMIGHAIERHDPLSIDMDKLKED